MFVSSSALDRLNKIVVCIIGALDSINKIVVYIIGALDSLNKILLLYSTRKQRCERLKRYVLYARNGMRIVFALGK